MKRAKKEHLLFIGDSVTDAGRDHANPTDWGQGYVRSIAERFRTIAPDANLVISNRGIGGNKITDLENRWREDCLALNPSILTILIGVNDTWHHVDDVDFGSAERMQAFEEGYRRILTQVKKETAAKIIVMEPFVLPYPHDRMSWRKDLDPRIQAVRRIANEYADAFVPLDEIMNAAGKEFGDRNIADDGVHPTSMGHQVIADAWLQIIPTLGFEESIRK